MIDLHCHILPGVDDGARDLAEAVRMCRLAAADGCEAMVATPHQRRGTWWNCDPEELEALRLALAAAVGPELAIYPGGEVHVDAQLLADLAQGGPLPLAGSRYLLIEFDGADRPEEAMELVHELAVDGWRPILAHPEFVPWMAEDEETVARLVELGAAAQVTAMSVTGDFGRRPQAVAMGLVEAGLAHFVASDSHGVSRRPPGLKRAYEALATRFDEATARRLAIDNPRAVLADRPLDGAGATEQP